MQITGGARGKSGADGHGNGLVVGNGRLC
jgi:hypothetical protein